MLKLVQLRGLSLFYDFTPIDFLHVVKTLLGKLEKRWGEWTEQYYD